MGKGQGLLFLSKSNLKLKKIKILLKKNSPYTDNTTIKDSEENYMNRFVKLLFIISDSILIPNFFIILPDAFAKTGFVFNNKLSASKNFMAF